MIKNTILQNSVLLILVMVMMPVMMVMVMSVSALGMVDGTILFVAVLARGFEFQRCVGNSMFGKLFAHGFLDVMGIALGYHMERCIVIVPVHTPHVHMVNVLYALNV